MYKKCLSIIIPTKNRQKYALSCIKTILNLTDEDFEIVVQDNSDEPILEEQIASIKDNRIVYNYHEGVLSFCKNFEKAVELSSGDYLIIIGDDDCVLPQIFELVKILREKSIESVYYSVDSIYKWPGSLGNSGGTITMRKSKPSLRYFSTKNSIEKMASIGNFDYQKYHFPKVYHGIIKRQKMDEVKQKTGSYFAGLTPDIYSAISLSFCVDKVLYINYPFSLPGICRTSGSADSLTGKHTGSLKDAPHFRGNDNYIWDKKVPYVYSVQSIWAETAIKAIKDNGSDFDFTNKQLFKFVSVTAFQCPTLIDELTDAYCDKTNMNKKKIKKSILRHMFCLKIRRFFRKSFSFLKQILHGRKTVNNVKDISDAVVLMNNYFKKYNLLFRKLKNKKA